MNNNTENQIQDEIITCLTYSIDNNYSDMLESNLVELDRNRRMAPVIHTKKIDIISEIV